LSGGTRLAFFARGVFLAESAFYAVVPPLVHGFVRDAHMTTTEVGILVAGYPAGMLVAAVPSMALVNRRGVRTTTIVGLGVLVLSTLVFAWSSNALQLDLARFVQGVGGAVAWAGALAWLTSESAAARRGAAIGGAVGSALIGMVLGPAIGAAATHVGRGAVFSLMAVVLAIIAFTGPPAPDSAFRRREWIQAFGRLFRTTSANLGNALLFVLGIVNGTVASLVPLLVARRQGDATTIAIMMAAIYLLSSSINVMTGRLSDRIGRLLPTVAGLIVAATIIPFLPTIGTLLVLAVATLIGAAVVSGLWTVSAAMVSDGADSGQSGQSVAVAFMNAASAAGAATGAIVVSRLADIAGFTVPFVFVGGLCGVAALATLVIYRRVPAKKKREWTLV
jgi:MFS family permease